MTVKNVAEIYATAPYLSNLKKLLITILDSDRTVNQIIAAICPPDELVTSDSVRERLRRLVKEGHPSLRLKSNQQSRLEAVLELGGILSQPPSSEGVFVTTFSIAAHLLQAAIGWESVEHFAVLILDAKHRVKSLKVLTVGTPTETIISPAQVFEAVLRFGGSRCLVAHNHPSGDVSEPSPEDLKRTVEVLQAGQVIEIPVLDHLIVSGNASLSLRSTTTLWQDYPQGDQQGNRR